MEVGSEVGVQPLGGSLRPPKGGTPAGTPAPPPAGAFKKAQDNQPYKFIATVKMGQLRLGSAFPFAQPPGVTRFGSPGDRFPRFTQIVGRNKLFARGLRRLGTEKPKKAAIETALS